MGILERLRRLIASNINALLESIDPGAAIDELIGNMESAAREARERVKEALTEDKRAARHVQVLEQSIAEWGARAERAVRAKDDGLAREALERKQTLEAERAETEAARQKGRGELDELERGLRELDGKLAAVKARKETLKNVMRARAQGGGAADRYDRIVSDVDVKEAENTLDAELGGGEAKSAEVRQRIDKLEADRDVADRLAALKDRLGKK
jgi:phage shock protein A